MSNASVKKKNGPARVALRPELIGSGDKHSAELPLVLH
jgi:hypothetical protein